MGRLDGSSSGSNVTGIAVKVVVALVAIFLLAGFLGSWVTIQAGHRGVVMHWGKVQPQVLDEGLHFTCPFMTSVQKLSVRVDKNQVKANGASKDMQTVTTDVAVNWHLKAEDVQKVFQTVGGKEVIVENILTPAVNEVFKAACSRLAASDILAKRMQLKEDVDKSLNSRLAKYNIIVDDISIVDINFGEEFSKAIEAKQVAEQEAEQAKYTAMKATQEALAKVNTAKGDAEAQRLVQSTLTGAILKQKAIDKWDGKFPVVMGSGSLPLLDMRNFVGSTQSTEEK